jgi:hypothetical protein
MDLALCYSIVKELMRIEIGSQVRDVESRKIILNYARVGVFFMTTVVLFPPNTEAETFLNATDISIAGGVLTFCWRAEGGGDTGMKKFRTTVPFTVQEEIGG